MHDSSAGEMQLSPSSQFHGTPARHCRGVEGESGEGGETEKGEVEGERQRREKVGEGERRRREKVKREGQGEKK